METSTEHYRVLFQEHFPLSIDRVETPWMEVPDEVAFNHRAFKLVEFELLDLTREGQNKRRASSRGFLVLGEAGAGKTHLLMRLAKNLSRQAPLLFIPRPTNENAVAQHIWECALDSLAKPSPAKNGRSESQLEHLLDEVFAGILAEALTRDIASDRDTKQKRRWQTALASKSPRELLGREESRKGNLVFMRNLILNHISACMPQVNLQIADTLLTYYVTIDNTYRRVLLNCLTCNEVTDEQRNRYRIPNLLETDDGSQSQAEIQQAREAHAQRCLQTLGELSVGHTPMILAFDQLEHLRSEERLTNSWANVLRDLFTYAPNYLVVTCVFPSLWDGWFSEKLEQSAVHRIAQNQVRLEQFKPEHGERLLAAHLRRVFSEHRLPHALFPFTPEAVKALCEDASSVRVFLQKAKEKLKEWMLFGDEFDVTANSVTENTLADLTSDKIDAVFGEYHKQQERKHFNEYSSRTPSEQSLFGKLRELAEPLYDANRQACPVELNAGVRVLPTYHVFKSSATENQAVLAVCNANAIAFTARVTNLLRSCENQSKPTRIVLVRDARFNKYTPTMQAVLEELQSEGHSFFEVEHEQHASLMAMHDCLVAIEEGDLAVAGLTLGMEHFRPYLMDRINSQENSPLNALVSGGESNGGHDSERGLILDLDINSLENWDLELESL